MMSLVWKGTIVNHWNLYLRRLVVIDQGENVGRVTGRALELTLGGFVVSAGHSHLFVKPALKCFTPKSSIGDIVMLTTIFPCMQASCYVNCDEVMRYII